MTLVLDGKERAAFPLLYLENELGQTDRLRTLISPWLYLVFRFKILVMLGEGIAVC